MIKIEKHEDFVNGELRSRRYTISKFNDGIGLCVAVLSLDTEEFSQLLLDLEEITFLEDKE